MKYTIKRGNTYHQCAWLVNFKHNTIAEFWSYKDALKFRSLKNKEFRNDKRRKAKN